MTRFVEVLDLKAPWRRAADGIITISELSNVVINRLESLEQYTTDPNLENIVEGFRKLRDKGFEASVMEFDALMKHLYDWTDEIVEDDESFFNTKKRCWIQVM
jgi:hypothetical protein